MQQQRDLPFLWEKVGRQTRPLYWKELGVRINMLVRGLDALGIARQDRVGVLTERGINSFFAHLATLALGGISTCFTRSCSMEDCAASLRESGSKLAFVDTLDKAEELLEHRGRLPQLTHIVVMEAIGTAGSGGTAIITFLDLMEKGKAHPDRTPTLLKQIQPSDRALLIYTSSDIGPRAAMLTHGELATEFAQIQKTLAPLMIDKEDLVMIASPFHESALHFVTAMLPLWHGAQGYYHEGSPLEELTLVNLNPSVMVGESGFFHALKKEAQDELEESGKVDEFIMRNALKLGKANYERPGQLTFKERMMHKLLHSIFIRKFRERISKRLRAVVSIDSNVSYDAQLFFYSFGVELYELDDGA